MVCWSLSRPGVYRGEESWQTEQWRLGSRRSAKTHRFGNGHASVLRGGVWGNPDVLDRLICFEDRRTKHMFSLFQYLWLTWWFWKDGSFVESTWINVLEKIGFTRNFMRCLHGALTDWPCLLTFTGYISHSKQERFCDTELENETSVNWGRGRTPCFKS